MSDPKRRAEVTPVETCPCALQAQPQPRANLLAAAIFVALPPMFFFAFLFRNALDIPYLDDYDAVLSFVNRFVQIQTISDRASYFLAMQHGEFKLLFLHGLACLQFYLRGHIDFRVLSILGDGFILMLAILLWKMFLPDSTYRATRLAFFIPVSWLIFQLQYCEALNFATPGLQHIAVLPFSLGAIYLLVRDSRWSFVLAVVFLIAAVSSDGNGLLVIPVGALILILGRQFARTAIWAMVSSGCIAAYAYRYDTMKSATDPHHSIVSALLRFRPDFVVAFIGGAAGFPFQFRAGSLVLGFLLCACFVYMAWRGYMRRNPAASYCVLFLLLTAVGVAGLRSDFGAANLPSRYMMYSALFLAFAWFAIAEEFSQYSRAPFLSNGIYLGAVALAILFSLSMDLIGGFYIEQRNQDIVKGMTAFEHPTAADPAPSPASARVLLNTAADTQAFHLRARAVLIESMKLGVYRPPPL